jgi:hypothetical protein
MPSITAVHEAGHAVAAVVLRREFGWVSVVAEGNLAGRIWGWRPADYLQSRNSRRMAVILYASFVAEVRYRRECGDDGPPSVVDMLGFQSDIRHLDLFDYKDDQEVQADAIDIIGEHWDAVLRVADALDAAKTLTRRQVVDLVKPRPSAAR